MGLYINPPSTSKEEFLEVHGKQVKNVDQISEAEYEKMKASGEVICCLVDNGRFTAAGVGFDYRELKAFCYSGDDRIRFYFVVPLSTLTPKLAGIENEQLREFDLPENKTA